MELKVLFVQKLVEKKELAVSRVDGSENNSDLMTKAIDKTSLERHAKALGLLSEETLGWKTVPAKISERVRPLNFQVERCDKAVKKLVGAILTCAVSQVSGEEIHQKSETEYADDESYALYFRVDFRTLMMFGVLMTIGTIFLRWCWIAV